MGSSTYARRLSGEWHYASAQTASEVNVVTLRGATAGAAAGGVGEPEETTVAMLRSEPDTFMPPESKRYRCDPALAEAVDAARANGMSSDGQSELRRMVLGAHRKWFRPELLRDPPADVEPLRVRRNAAVHAARAKPRPMSPEKAKLLVMDMEQLTAVGMVYRSAGAVSASVAVAMQKLQSDRMVELPRNEQHARARGDILTESSGNWSDFSGRAYFLPVVHLAWVQAMPAGHSGRGALHDGHAGKPVHAYARSTRFSQCDDFISRRHEERIGGLLGRMYLVWVDDIVIWAATKRELRRRLCAVLESLIQPGIHTASHEA